MGLRHVTLYFSSALHKAHGEGSGGGRFSDHQLWRGSGKLCDDPPGGPRASVDDSRGRGLRLRRPSLPFILTTSSTTDSVSAAASTTSAAIAAIAVAAAATTAIAATTVAAATSAALSTAITRHPSIAATNPLVFAPLPAAATLSTVTAPAPLSHILCSCPATISRERAAPFTRITRRIVH